MLNSYLAANESAGKKKEKKQPSGSGSWWLRPLIGMWSCRKGLFFKGGVVTAPFPPFTHFFSVWFSGKTWKSSAQFAARAHVTRTLLTASPRRVEEGWGGDIAETVNSHNEFSVVGQHAAGVSRGLILLLFIYIFILIFTQKKRKKGWKQQKQKVFASCFIRWTLGA